MTGNAISPKVRKIRKRGSLDTAASGSAILSGEIVPQILDPNREIRSGTNVSVNNKVHTLASSADGVAQETA